MKAQFDISPDDMALILRALDHYHAYTRAVQREDRSYAILRERLERSIRKPARGSRAKTGRSKR